MQGLQAEVSRLLLFWAMIVIPCAVMLVLVWFFRMGDRHMIRRTSIYFATIFLLLPLITFFVYLQLSPSLAKMSFITFFIIGTIVYFVFTAKAVLRPRS